MLMTYYESAIVFAIIGVVLVRLQEPEEILDFVPRWLTDGTLVKKLLTCAKCLAGQIAFWVMLGVGIVMKMPFPYWVFSIVTVFMSIFFALVLTLIIDKIE